MKTKKLFLVIIFLSVPILLNCTEDNSSKNTVKEADGEKVSDKSICELFSKEEVGKIMGVTFEESTQTLHTVNSEAGSYVSQCAYYTNKGLQHIAVVVRHFENTTFPQTAEEFLSASKVGDAELDKEVERAMKSYIKVDGLGDAAFFYSLWESNLLVVHWDKHYEMIISMYDFSLDPATMEKVKQVAKGVMKKMN
jgi:hypothetical protein